MAQVGGMYIKGSGYTPIYVCTRLEDTQHGGIVLAAVGSGLDFVAALKYAQSDVQYHLGHGYQIRFERDTLFEPNRDDEYECALYRGDDFVLIRVNKCALMHE